MSYAPENKPKRKVKKPARSPKYISGNAYIPEGQKGWDKAGSFALYRHNNRVYKANGWTQHSDGNWTPPRRKKRYVA